MPHRRFGPRSGKDELHSSVPTLQQRHLTSGGQRCVSAHSPALHRGGPSRWHRHTAGAAHGAAGGPAGSSGPHRLVGEGLSAPAPWWARCMDHLINTNFGQNCSFTKQP
jgi:hypothetical protein